MLGRYPVVVQRICQSPREERAPKCYPCGALKQSALDSCPILFTQDRLQPRPQRQIRFKFQSLASTWRKLFGRAAESCQCWPFNFSCHCALPRCRNMRRSVVAICARVVEGKIHISDTLLPMQSSVHHLRLRRRRQNVWGSPRERGEGEGQGHFSPKARRRPC